LDRPLLHARAAVGQQGEPVTTDQADDNLESPSLPPSGPPNISVGRKRSSDGGIETTPQHFGGALATLIFGAALLSERLNGIGIVQNLELHNEGLHPVLLGSIALLMAAAAWPEARENSSPGLIVRLQMAGARIAYLGLAGSIAAEMFTGKVSWCNASTLSCVHTQCTTEKVSDREKLL